MKKKIKVVCLFGESSVGKDSVLNAVCKLDKNYHKIISCTTRPPREKEINKVDYHFVSPDMFGEMVMNGTMLEAVSFREWFYGTPLFSLEEDKINIGCFNIAGIECLMQDSALEVYPIKVAASDKLRLIRALNREENPDCEEVCRRFLADKKDFSDIPFEYSGISTQKGIDEQLLSTLTNYLNEL